MSTYFDYVWYSNPTRARSKARRIVQDTKRSVIIIHSALDQRYGVGFGTEMPPWNLKEMTLWRVMHHASLEIPTEGADHA